MNKIILASLVLFGLSSLGAQDFGGILKNSLVLDAGSEGLTDTRDSLGLQLWAGYESQTLLVRLQGTFTYQYFQESSTNRLIPELDLAYLKLAFPGFPGEGNQALLALGRLSTSDPSRLFLDSVLDQLDFTMKLSDFSFRIGTGYNGLISKYTSDLGYNLTDSADQNDTTRYLSSPRLLAWFWTGWKPNPNHLLYVGYIRQQDLRAVAQPDLVLPAEGDFVFDPSKSGLFHTNYFQVDYRFLEFGWGLSFNLGGVLGQGASLSYIAGDQYKLIPHLGYMLYLGSSWDSSDKALRVSLNGLHSSGDTNKRLQFDEGATINEELTTLSTFKSASAPVFSQIFNPKPGNLSLFKLRFSHQPWISSSDDAAKGLMYSTEVASFFRSNTGPISAANTNPLSVSSYLGTEIDAGVNWRPMSDLGLALNLGFFFPAVASDGVFEGIRPDMEQQTSFTLSIAF